MSLLEQFPLIQNCCLCANLRQGALLTSVYLFLETVALITVKIIYLTYEDPDDSGLIFWTTVAQIILLHLPQVILTLVLFVGALKKKIQLIAVYSWITLLLIVIELILLVASLMAYPREAIYFILIFGFHCYLWLCTNSYFLQLKQDEEVVYKRKFQNSSTNSSLKH